MKQNLTFFSEKARLFFVLITVLAAVGFGIIFVNHYFSVQAATANSVQINAGGGADAPFVADEDFNGANACGGTNTAINISGIKDPAPQEVYQTSRCGDFTYGIPNLIPYASYTVRLHFAETYRIKAGQRIFNVRLNGHQVLSSFDILATAGGVDKAVVEQFTTAADGNGVITIQFIAVKDSALVSGIEILRSSTGHTNVQGSVN